MYRIALCENSEQDRLIISSYLKKRFFELSSAYQLSEFISGESFLENMEPYRYDIAIFDVEMEKISGIRAARMLRDADKKVVIIFTSVHAESVFSSFYAEPLNFMVKPVSYPEFRQVLDLALKKVEEVGKTSFTYTSSNALFSVPISQILYFESDKRVITVKMTEGSDSFYGKLGEIERNPVLSSFLRCYQSYLVNPDCVYRITNSSVVLKNGEELPISRGKAKLIKSLYMEYISGIKL